MGSSGTKKNRMKKMNQSQKGKRSLPNKRAAMEKNLRTKNPRNRRWRMTNPFTCQGRDLGELQRSERTLHPSQKRRPPQLWLRSPSLHQFLLPRKRLLKSPPKRHPRRKRHHKSQRPRNGQRQCQVPG